MEIPRAFFMGSCESEMRTQFERSCRTSIANEALTDEPEAPKMLSLGEAGTISSPAPFFVGLHRRVAYPEKSYFPGHKKTAGAWLLRFKRIF